MSISITSPYAVERDPRLNKVLERANDIEKCIKDLESKAKHLQSTDSAGSDGFFEEFEEAIEKLLKDLVLDLRSARSSTSDKLSWLRLPPDYITDHTDFLGQLYCTLKLSEQIHEENCQIENAHLGLLPPRLEQLSSQDNDYIKTPRTDTETLSNQLSGWHQQDDRHRKATLSIIQDLADFSKAFGFYHFRLRNYVQELRDQQAEQPDLLDSTSLASEKLMERLYPPTLSPLEGPSRQESCPAQREYLARSQSDEVAPKSKQRNEGLKRKRGTKEERSERGLKELSDIESQDTRQKRRKPSEGASDTCTELWYFDPDKEEFKELKEIRDEVFTQLVLMRENNGCLKKLHLKFTKYDIEIKSKV